MDILPIENLIQLGEYKPAFGVYYNITDNEEIIALLANHCRSIFTPFGISLLVKKLMKDDWENKNIEAVITEVKAPQVENYIVNLMDMLVNFYDKMKNGNWKEKSYYRLEKVRFHSSFKYLSWILGKGKTNDRFEDFVLNNNNGVNSVILSTYLGKEILFFHKLPNWYQYYDAVNLGYFNAEKAKKLGSDYMEGGQYYDTAYSVFLEREKNQGALHLSFNVNVVPNLARKHMRYYEVIKIYFTGLWKIYSFFSSRNTAYLTVFNRISSLFQYILEWTKYVVSLYKLRDVAPLFISEQDNIVSIYEKLQKLITIATAFNVCSSSKKEKGTRLASKKYICVKPRIFIEKQCYHDLSIVTLTECE
jgi:hypothetical protein